VRYAGFGSQATLQALRPSRRPRSAKVRVRGAGPVRPFSFASPDFSGFAFIALQIRYSVVTSIMPYVGGKQRWQNYRI
jgi:hypothetical protein